MPVCACVMCLAARLRTMQASASQRQAHTLGSRVQGYVRSGACKLCRPQPSRMSGLHNHACSHAQGTAIAAGYKHRHTLLLMGSDRTSGASTGQPGGGHAYKHRHTVQL